MLSRVINYIKAIYNMSDSEEPSEQPPVPLWLMWDDYESEWIDEGKLRARVEAMEARLRARLVELNYLRLCGFCGFEILSYLFYSSSSTINVSYLLSIINFY